MHQSAQGRSFIWTDDYSPARPALFLRRCLPHPSNSIDPKIVRDSNLPGPQSRRADARSCLVLQAVGFTLPKTSPSSRCALTAPFQPYLCPEGPSAVCFLWHFPEDRSRWPLAITAPCPARTFLPSPKRDERPPRPLQPIQYNTSNTPTPPPPPHNKTCLYNPSNLEPLSFDSS